MTSYKFGEIVLVDFPQSGTVQRKKRPALIVLDIGDADIILAPITTKERFDQGDYKLKGNRSGGHRRTCRWLVQNILKLSKQAGSMFYNYQTR